MKNNLKYLVVGLVAGSLMTVSAGVFADKIQSMVGKKVDREYVVQINGNSLTDKAISVDGKAHLPVRSITDALGANVKSVSNGVITLTTSQEVPENPIEKPIELPVEKPTVEISTNNKYANKSKQDLEKDLKQLKDNQLKSNLEARAELIKSVEQAKKDGATSYVEEKEKVIKQYDGIISNLEKEVQEIESAIASKQ